MPEPQTMEQRFARCLDEILRHEGGYADHPRDPGGATNLGITRKTLARWRGIRPWWKLNKGEVRRLGRGEAGAIYKARYWDRAKAADLPPGLDLALLDFAVNSGPDRAVKALQRSLEVKADGHVGPLTLEALKRRVAAAGVAGLIVALCNGRLGFLQRLASFAVFGRGWSRRIKEIRAAALAMAGAPASLTLSSTQTRSHPMTFLAGYKTYIVALAMLVGGLAQLLGVDLPALDGQSAGHLLMEGLAIFFLRQGIRRDVGNA